MNNSKADFIVTGASHTLKKMLDNIEIEETKIHQTPKISLLGVYLDRLLDLKNHI